MVREPVPDVGLTHASMVRPVVTSSDGASATVIDESSARTPTPSLKPYAATSPGCVGGDGGTVGVLFSTDTVTASCDRLPAASRAIAVSVCRPSAVVALFHAI